MNDTPFTWARRHDGYWTVRTAGYKALVFVFAVFAVQAIYAIFSTSFTSKSIAVNVYGTVYGNVYNQGGAVLVRGVVTGATSGV